jgi:hypothetical protein
VCLPIHSSITLWLKYSFTVHNRTTINRSRGSYGAFWGCLGLFSASALKLLALGLIKYAIVTRYNLHVTIYTLFLIAYQLLSLHKNISPGVHVTVFHFPNNCVLKVDAVLRFITTQLQETQVTSSSLLDKRVDCNMLCLRSEDAFVITCVANIIEVKVLYVQQDLRYDISSYWRFNV